MKEQGRIEELLAESLHRQDKMLEVLGTLVDTQRQTNLQVERTNDFLNKLLIRVEKVEENQMEAKRDFKVITQSVGQLNEQIGQLLRLEERVAALEKAVFS